METPLTLSTATWKFDFARLPPELRAAWLSHPAPAQIIRLTADIFAFRPSSGSGVWTISPLSGLLPLIQAAPIPQPYRPPAFSPAESDPLDLSQLNITLD